MKNQSPLLRKSAWSLIGVPAFCILLITLIWDSELKQIRRDHDETLAAVVQQNNNRVAALEQYAIRTIQNADAVLQLVVKELAHSSPVPPLSIKLPPAPANELLATILVADAKGTVTSISSDSSVGKLPQVAAQEYFRFHTRLSADSLYIGKPMHCPLVDRQVIALSRRITPPGGGFAGVVAVLIEPSALTKFYAQANLLPHDILSLVAPDGTTYARRTGPRESFGENIRKSPLYRHLERQAVGSYRANDAIRGVPTFFSYRKLKDFPIIATVGAAEAEVMAGFYHRTRRAYNSALILSAAVALFSMLVCFFIRVHRRQTKIIRDSETRYRSLFENSPDAILLADPFGNVLEANPASCTILGRSKEEIFALGRTGLADTSDPRLAELLEERSRTGKARGEISLLDNKGIPFPAEVTTALFTDATGQQFATMFIRDITKQKRLQKKILQEQKRFQRKLTEQVIRAQEREREVIGRELHDNVNQVLTTVKLYLELAQTDKTSCEVLLPRCVGHVMDSINEIRKLSRDLSAPTLGTRSLADSVEALVDMIRSSSGLRMTLRHNLQPGSLAMDLKLAVYRILQEQLNNVVRHARASKVLITLNQQPSCLLVTIKDNGQGFDPRQQREGIGINNMISRVKVFDGKISINAAPGKGCTVQIMVPVPTVPDEGFTTNAVLQFSEA
ncbi:MAG TPA: PAS domain S-box protein [Chitinophagaceae bacterium]